MKKILTVIILVFLMYAVTLNAQALDENFNYGISDNSDITVATANWTRHSGAQGPQYSATGLTYSGYASSGIGGAISFTNGGSGTNDGDVNRTFTEINTTSDIYISFLVNVASALATQDYFIHIGQTTIGTTFRGRIYARTNSTGWSLSLSKTGTPIVQDATVLNFNQTYLVVLKYVLSTATTSDDQVQLYVYDSGVPSTEPGSPLVTIAATGSGVTDGLTNLGTVAIRQGTNTPTAKVDGIRVGTDWDFIALPVELTSFTGVAKGRSVELAWQTATEVNNHGFEVERAASLNPSKGGTSYGTWTKVGFVAGSGTVNTPKSYSFVDATAKGKVVYRLKQIDNDGQFEYHGAVEVMISQMPQKLALMQNYPNPFNPTTNIQYSLPNAQFVSLKVYDMLGKEIATLVNGMQEAGDQQATFTASNYPSGMYFYTLRTNNFTSTKKMLLVK